MAQMKVFVSHSHEDDAFCRALVDGLRRAGADVWYDEHNLGSGQLMSIIQRELGERPVFVVILSKAAFASRWVKRETQWAYELADRNPSRTLLPVTGGPIKRDDFSAEGEWLFLHDFKRVEAPGLKPYPMAEAVTRTQHALHLTLPSEAPQPVAPQPREGAADLVTRGDTLQTHGKHAKALAAREQSTSLDPQEATAQVDVSIALDDLNPHMKDLAACDQYEVAGWKGAVPVLVAVGLPEEALAAFEKWTVYDPLDAEGWVGKGSALSKLGRHEEALAAYDHAITLNQYRHTAWVGKAAELVLLQRYDEGLAAYEQVLDSAWLGRDGKYGFAKERGGGRT